MVGQTSMPHPIQPTFLGGRRVMFAMAVELEYGQAQRELFAPLFTGVGPVEAGIVVGAALARLRAIGELPELLVSLGSAGSRTLAQAAVFQVSSVSYRDMNASVLGFPRGETPFLGLPASLPLPCPLPDLLLATLATGASVVSGAAYDAVEADMVDMETFAVVRAAMRFGVPVIGLRGVSDGVSELAELKDWTAALHLVDEGLAQAVRALGELLAGGLDPSSLSAAAY
ncbi:MAG TPA: 5'-methylthioadenosine/S-adenosylhomocysteine nucleosidase [Mesorhizobium sp.]|nr:5'-methylthioadenosine/S-adenosylhomocysteine nucleosidase [Mesorhizobium sp.]